MGTEQHESLPQLSGASLLDIKSLAAQAENAAITARSRTDTLIQAYLELQKQNVKQHALIAQMAEALSGVLNIRNDSYGVAGYHLNGEVERWDGFPEVAAADEAIAAATQYLKGPKT